MIISSGFEVHEQTDGLHGIRSPMLSINNVTAWLGHQINRVCGRSKVAPEDKDRSARLFITKLWLDTPQSRD
jgi:hypothetical protein